MKQSYSWEDDSRTAGQENPCLLWNSKPNRRLQNRLPLCAILSQINPVLFFTHTHTHTHSSFNIHSTLSFLLRLGLSKVVSSLQINQAKFHTPLTIPCVLHESPISFPLLWYFLYYKFAHGQKQPYICIYKAWRKLETFGRPFSVGKLKKSLNTGGRWRINPDDRHKGFLKPLSASWLVRHLQWWL
jgi:hypothetical protein